MFGVHIVLILIMIIAAIIAIEAKEMITSVISTGAAGLALSASFLLLKSPDLAIILLIVEVVTLTVLVRLTTVADALPEAKGDRMLTAVIVLFVALFLMVAILAIRDLSWFRPARLTDAALAQYADMSSRAGSRNVVTTLALDMRLYDTLAGLFVLFAAALGVRMILNGNGRSKK
jgi:multisubunit Na+/H+ antiporter MnhB subunit